MKCIGKGRTREVVCFRRDVSARRLSQFRHSTMGLFASPSVVPAQLSFIPLPQHREVMLVITTACQTTPTNSKTRRHGQTHTTRRTVCDESAAVCSHSLSFVLLDICPTLNKPTTMRQQRRGALTDVKREGEMKGSALQVTSGKR